MARVFFYLAGMRRVIAVLVAVIVMSCSGPTSGTSPSSPAAAARTQAQTESPRASTSAPTPSATPSPTPFATPSPITDLAQVFRPRVSTWRPTGPTVMAVTITDFTSTLVAIGLAAARPSGPATPLVDFAGDWDITRDGAKLAVGVQAVGGVRFATLDLTSGKTAWVTAPDAAVQALRPVWSNDGRYIYYATFGGPPAFRGAIKRVALDGSGATVITEQDRMGGLDGITPDGGKLIWERVQEGGSAELFDLASGVNRHVNDVARVSSVRERQPRMIVGVGGCCAGFPGGALELWDDDAMTSRVLADRAAATAWGAASWDPSGTRVVAVRYDAAHRYQGTLVFLDPLTGAVQPLGGAIVAAGVEWIQEGLVYSVFSDPGPAVELFIVSAAGGQPASLYTGANLHRFVIIRP
jgi:hypothetical protein